MKYTIKECRERQMVCHTPTKGIYDIVQGAFGLANPPWNSADWSKRCKEIGGEANFHLYLPNNGWGNSSDYKGHMYGGIIEYTDVIELVNIYSIY